MLDKTTIKQPIIRTSEGLRDALFDEIDGLRDGTGNVQSAITVANLSKQIINVIKAETEFRRLIAEGLIPESSLSEPLRLGRG